MELKYFDKYGVEQPLAAMYARFGDVRIHPIVGPGWRVAELHENANLDGADVRAARVAHLGTVFEEKRKEVAELEVESANGIMAAAVHMVHLRNADGSPFTQGHEVAWYYSTAQMRPAKAPTGGLPGSMLPTCDVGVTNGNGDVGFAMGGGAYYFVPGQGPHATWLCATNSEVLVGIGMLGGTDHDNLWAVWQWDEGEEEPPPENEALVRIAVAAEEAAVQTKRAANQLKRVADWLER